MKLNERYFIKIVPHRGETVHRFELTRKNIVTAACALVMIGVVLLGFGLVQLWRAHAQVSALQSLAAKQQRQLTTFNRKTATIRKQLLHVQKQNQQIQQLIGVHVPVQKTSEVRPSIDALALASEQTLARSNMLRRMTMRVLNVRHLQELMRAREIAEIPSIDPVDGAPVVGCFCYRTYPDSEFHEGVDLGADWGDTVHAAAAGTVASAGWDGGYGERIVIDHGNGYETWYAHLSHIGVQIGEYVHKGEDIGEVGSTGFSTGPHLHYQVMLDGVAVDPDPYLNGVPTNVLAKL